jgi:hypothetical protein
MSEADDKRLRLQPLAAELARLSDLRDQGKGGNFKASTTAVVRAFLSENPDLRTDVDGLLGTVSGVTPEEIQPFTTRAETVNTEAKLAWGNTAEGRSAYLQSVTLNPDGTIDQLTTEAKFTAAFAVATARDATASVLKTEVDIGKLSSESIIQDWSGDALGRSQSEVDGIISSYDADSPMETADILKSVLIRKAQKEAELNKELAALGVVDPTQKAAAIAQALAPYDNFSALVASNDKVLTDTLSHLRDLGRMDLGRHLSSTYGYYGFDLAQSEFVSQQFIVSNQAELTDLVKKYDAQIAAGVIPISEATDTTSTMDENGEPIYGGYTESYLEPYKNDPDLATTVLKTNIPMLEKNWTLSDPQKSDTYANLLIESMGAAYAQLGALGGESINALLNQRVKEFKTILAQGSDASERLELHTSDFIVEQIGRNVVEVENQLKNLPKGFYLKNVNGKYSLELDPETFRLYDDPASKFAQQALLDAGLEPTVGNLLSVATDTTASYKTSGKYWKAASRPLQEALAGIERMNSISVFAKTVPQLQDNFAQGVERFVPDERKRLIEEANASSKVKDDSATFSTPEEAQAAQDQGLLVPGQIVYINGKRYKVTP